MGLREAGADGLPEEKPEEIPGGAPPEAPVEAGGDEGAEEAVGGRRPVRRGRRTGALIAGAAVLGLVAGTCTGYLVQADREPTKLPSLSQPAIAQAKGPAPEPLSAARDRRVKTDGDLRELLLSKPKGAEDADWLEGGDGWIDLAGYADLYEEPDQAFGDLLGNEFRRAATTGWKVSSTYTVEIRLVQFRQEETLAAAEHCDNQQYWAEKDSTDSWPVPGTGTGMAYVRREAATLYSARALAWRGDIAMEIWVHWTKPISQQKIMDLAERQMERL
ncbi:hypothetical protein [Streptomyces sp. NPDC059894]|uniref:hypothetical protein n=1 Tax=unclassified Streptomyces TaxID=2593676 RepID=UPI00366A524A